MTDKKTQLALDEEYMKRVREQFYKIVKNTKWDDESKPKKTNKKQKSKS